MAIDIGRREFYPRSAARLCWPLTAHAQQQGERIRRIGFLGHRSLSDPFAQGHHRERLFAWARCAWLERRRQPAHRLALGRCRRPAHGTPSGRTSRTRAGRSPRRRQSRRSSRSAQQTKTIPVVFALVSDPVGMGYVHSLALPGGNIIGFSSYDPPIYTKQLQMLTEITPPAATVAVLYNPESAPYAGRMVRAMEDAAKSLGVVLRDAPCHDDGEIEAMMAALAQARARRAVGSRRRIQPSAYPSDHRPRA